MIVDGLPKDAVNRYVGFVLDREQSGSKEASSLIAADKTAFRHGDGTSRIVDVQILNGRGSPASTLQRGDEMTIRVRAEFLRESENPVVGILVRNRIGMDVFGTNTRVESVALGNYRPGDVLDIDFRVECLFSRQEYTLTVATQHASGLSQDWLDDVLEFSVIDTKDVAGVLHLETALHFTHTCKPDEFSGAGSIK